MRLLIISDIHANLTAFETVLADAKGEWDEIWCLGDVIGYGPDPNECAALLCQYDHVSLSGNHDWAVLDKLDITTFNHEARQAISWTQDAITEETRDYLKDLPPMAIAPPHFTLAHASPRHPVWEYILEAVTAAENFNYFETSFCLVGHTHTPIIFEQTAQNVTHHLPIYGHALSLEQFDGHRLIINPGSVGQPRDSDPRAAYALLDLDELTWEHRRVPYDIASVQARMRKHGLPERLAMRLEFGW
jgi:predicted phosphodiesterase